MFTLSLIVQCPPGYEAGYGDKCYRFVKELVDFKEARRRCQVPDGPPGPNPGDLAIIETMEELAYVMSKTMGGDWWIGE